MHQLAHNGAHAAAFIKGNGAHGLPQLPFAAGEIEGAGREQEGGKIAAAHEPIREIHGFPGVQIGARGSEGGDFFTADMQLHPFDAGQKGGECIDQRSHHHGASDPCRQQLIVKRCVKMQHCPSAAVGFGDRRLLGQQRREPGILGHA